MCCGVFSSLHSPAPLCPQSNHQQKPFCIRPWHSSGDKRATPSLPSATDAPQGFTEKKNHVFWSLQQVSFGEQGEPTESLKPPKPQGTYTQPHHEGCCQGRHLITSLKWEVPYWAEVSVVKLCFTFPHWNNLSRSGMQAQTSGTLSNHLQNTSEGFQGVVFCQGHLSPSPCKRRAKTWAGSSVSTQSLFGAIALLLLPPYWDREVMEGMLSWREISISVLKCTCHEMELLLW